LSSEEKRQLVQGVLGRSSDRGIARPDGSFAWSRMQCLDILRSLDATKVAVAGGEFFRGEPIGLVPAYDGWTCERAAGETATDYAVRSRSVATYQIEMEAHADLLAVLQLSDQDDAA
jgi:Immunity protein 40